MHRLIIPQTSDPADEHQGNDIKDDQQGAGSVISESNRRGNGRATSRRGNGPCVTVAAAAVGVIGAARVEALEPRTMMAAFTASINFQPAGATVPANYFADTGATYGNRGNGLTYGWDADNSANTRDRNNAASADQRYDTFAFTQRDSRQYRWELAVPAGVYAVRVVAGDAQAIDSLYGFMAETKTVAYGTPTTNNRWIDGTVVVPVTDGKLTLTNANRTSNNKLNFVTVNEVVPTGLRAYAVSDTVISLNWNDVSVAENGFRIERSTDGQNFTTVANVGPNVLAFSDTRRAAGVTYTYRVRCLAGGGISAPSDVATGKIDNSPLHVSFDNRGVTKLTYKDITLFDIAKNPTEGFHVHNQVLVRGNEPARTLNGTPESTAWNDAAKELTLRFSWGTIVSKFIVNGNELQTKIRVQNTTQADTITQLSMSPMTFRFPQMPDGFRAWPQIGANVNSPTVVSAKYGPAQLVFFNEDVTKPLLSGFLSSAATATENRYSVYVGTRRDGYAVFDRSIGPGQSDEYALTMRFDYSGVPVETVAADVYARYAATFPPPLNWTDRRAIGSIFFPENGATGFSATNPHGWWGDAKVDTVTQTGLIEFKKRFLADADRSVKVAKGMNAQGVIVWDLEGERYKGAVYVGDPRVATQTLPELGFDGTIDEYFRRFTSAGLRVGMTIRPTQFKVTGPDTGTQTDVADPAALMIEKVRYARERWGATMFYIDSNDPYRPEDIARLAAAFPDCLMIPEHEGQQSYGYSAPYGEVYFNDLGTTPAVRAMYPNAFGAIRVFPGLTPANEPLLISAVRAGDVLFFESWYDSPGNAAIKRIYDQAKALP